MAQPRKPRWGFRPAKPVCALRRYRPSFWGGKVIGPLPCICRLAAGLPCFAVLAEPLLSYVTRAGAPFLLPSFGGERRKATEKLPPAQSAAPKPRNGLPNKNL